MTTKVSLIIYFIHLRIIYLDKVSSVFRVFFIIQSWSLETIFVSDFGFGPEVTTNSGPKSIWIWFPKNLLVENPAFRTLFPGFVINSSKFLWLARGRLNNKGRNPSVGRCNTYFLRVSIVFVKAKRKITSNGTPVL